MTEPTHVWLATCPTCDATIAAGVDAQNERTSTFVRTHLLEGWVMRRVPRGDVTFGDCRHYPKRHTDHTRVVALRARVRETVRSDLPFVSPTLQATPGVYEVTMNRNGAASAVLPNGIVLGLKPDEFVWTDAPVAHGDREGVRG